MGGLPRKKGKEGEVTFYITRKAALRKLQLTLSQFRTLCILKGVFPREPKNKIGKHASKTFYFLKDIKHLHRDPMISVVRTKLSIEKKISKKKANGDKEAVKELESKIPDFDLKPVIRERYPSFIDALRDMDDSLSLLYIFENFPKFQTEHDKEYQGIMTNVQRKLREWESYIIKSRSLRKTFISIKGFYYQAEIMGQQITWLVPHRIVREVNPNEVDMKVMFTFLKYYDTLLSFVLFKLFNEVGISYPMSMDKLQEGDNQLDDLLQRLEGNRKIQLSQVQKNNKKETTSLQKVSEKRISSLNPQLLLSLDNQQPSDNLQIEKQPNPIENEFMKDHDQIVAQKEKKSLF